MLAHYAAYQGRIAAMQLTKETSDKKAGVSSLTVPNCIFTDPEIASVGINENQAMEKGLKTKKYRYDFLGCGMARVIDETDGFIKILADASSDSILGACIIGPKATELISVFAVAITNRLTVARVKETIFAHPTLSEAIGEALQHEL
jgi:dihydrolipoamide dehydrogenase